MAEWDRNRHYLFIPNEEERKYIDHVIADELEFGIVNPESKNKIDTIVQRLIQEEQIEAVILGCTELPLMYADDKLLIPVFDTLQYHIAGIIEYMFKE